MAVKLFRREIQRQQIGAGIVLQPSHIMDYLIFQKINGLAGKNIFLDSLAVFFAKYAGYVLMAVLILFLFKNFKKNWLLSVKGLGAAILARFGIVELIRFLWERPRPFVGEQVNLLLPHEASGSFPSGHAAFYFGLSSVVYFYNKKTGALFFVASFLISFFRVFAGVHWLSDILAGTAVGIFSGWLIAKNFKK